MPWTPYLVGIKIGAVILVIAGLFLSGVWLRGILAECTALRLSEAASKSAVVTLLDSIERNATLNREIADAIKNIRVVSNNYIQSIESDPPPGVPDGGTVVIINPGVPKAMSSVPKFTNYSTIGASTTAAGS